MKIYCGGRANGKTIKAIKLSINEGREYKEYTDSIHNFIIF